jgi:stage II sporulation protein R
MNTSSRLKKWEVSLLLALCLTTLAGTWAQARGQGLSSELIRLHVVAASDDAAEQRIKLRVRDSVLSYLAPRLESAGSAGQAASIIQSDMDGITAAAEEAAAGRAVTVTLSEEYYPTRQYRNYSLPAGKYRSLRVVLGEGAGHNWWCVVFPPLCLSAAEEPAVKAALSDEDYGIVSGNENYALKFRLLELWGELMRTVNR